MIMGGIIKGRNKVITIASIKMTTHSLTSRMSPLLVFARACKKAITPRKEYTLLRERRQDKKGSRKRIWARSGTQAPGEIAVSRAR
jgi:hypothetical protein